MRTTLVVCPLVVCLLASIALTADAAQPRIVNGTVATRPVGSSLAAGAAAAAREAHVVWVGYAVPANEAGRESCGHSWRNGAASRGVTLEGESSHAVRNTGAADTLYLEGASEVGVFVRFQAGAFSRAVASSLDCEIDAGGRAVIWLTGVDAHQSLAWLPGLASGNDGRSAGRDGVLAAIAFHADGEADAVLERLAMSNPSPKARQSAVFWMGAARGAPGLAGLQRIFEQHTDDKLREQVVFAVSVSKEPGGTDLLLKAARDDRHARVRGAALFWLAQKAGARVADAVENAVRDDPDTEVKKRAVFALSQMPRDEGVPRLIGIARTHRNPEVRKQAMFWLGQSKDPRALAFFEEILARH